MPGFAPEPLRVACDSCGAEGWTFDYQRPDLAVVCGCCPVAHDHTGLGCRPVRITATAHLTILDPADLLDMLPAGDDRAPMTQEEASPRSSRA